MLTRGALALGLVVVGAVVTWRLTGGRGPYRVGPWPGLTGRGAGVLIGCALLLAGVQVYLGSPARAWPDLAVIAVASVVPLVLATRVVRAPGAASAVCGAFLMPRSLLSVVEPGLDPPPLVLVGAIAFDVVLWVRRNDLAFRRRKRIRQPRRPTLVRGALAGAAFAIAFVAVEPAYAILLGADASGFAIGQVALAALTAACICGAIGAASRSGPGTG